MSSINYRWLDRRDRARGLQIHHAVDASTGKELCEEAEGVEVIQGAQSAGGDLYCVSCMRALVLGTAEEIK